MVVSCQALLRLCKAKILVKDKDVLRFISHIAIKDTKLQDGALYCLTLVHLDT